MSELKKNKKRFSLLFYDELRLMPQYFFAIKFFSLSAYVFVLFWDADGQGWDGGLERNHFSE